MEDSKPKPLEPPPPERIENDLNQVRSGQLAYWVQLTLDLSLEPTSTHYSGDNDADLTAMPGWKAANEATKSRIVDAAFRYVTNGEPENEKWFATPTIPYLAIGGFRALALFLITAEDKLRILEPDVWRKWVPILLSFPHGGRDERKLQCQLLQMAYSQVPEEVIARIKQLIDAENERSGFFSLLIRSSAAGTIAWRTRF